VIVVKKDPGLQKSDDRNTGNEYEHAGEGQWNNPIYPKGKASKRKSPLSPSPEERKKKGRGEIYSRNKGEGPTVA